MSPPRMKRDESKEHREEISRLRGAAWMVTCGVLPTDC
jgi:hypothetical protein